MSGNDYRRGLGARVSSSKEEAEDSDEGDVDAEDADGDGGGSEAGIMFGGGGSALFPFPQAVFMGFCWPFPDYGCLSGDWDMTPVGSKGVVVLAKMGSWYGELRVPSPSSSWSSLPMARSCCLFFPIPNIRCFFVLNLLVILGGFFVYNVGGFWLPFSPGIIGHIFVCVPGVLLCLFFSRVFPSLVY
ncbi:hypothetical protein SUGI_0475160 [Cryptomeria japonica]|nr:hypothetical protein SUGI_0475160 [Cryptomeria japonica]